MTSEHDKFYYAHDELIQQNKQDILELQKSLEGLPQMMRYIKETLDEVKYKLDNKVVQKEVCQLCHESQQKQIDELKEDLGKFKSWIIAVGATAAGTLIFELFKMVINK